MNRARLALCVFVTCGLSVIGMAQEERATAVVTAAAPVEKIRFAASPPSVQMRIEVRSSGGALLYDSDWKDGSILDWSPQDSSGQPLGFGAYRLVMQSKNLAGQTSEKEVALRVDSGGMAVEGQPTAIQKITLPAHDGDTGQLITTSGDLSFRFGDFLNRKDSEAMRLTAAGELSVSGIVRARGVMFPDGSILTTAAGLPGVPENDGTVRQRPSAPGGGTTLRSVPTRIVGPPIAESASITARRSPRPTASPDYQFKVDGTGVHIGTTPTFGLDVSGNATLLSNLDMLITTSGSVGVIEQNSNRWIHTFGDFNTFLGLVAGNFTMTGTANTGTGYRVFQNNTSGSNNTANGYRSLANNTTGDQNTASGSYSLNFNTTGVGNTATGVSALGGNATGNYNTADGVSALISNDNGHDNTASGYSAMYTNNHGNFNTASGSGALYHSTVDGNTAFGYQALTADYTGDGNTAVGYQALNSDSSGCCNIAIGTFAGSNIISSWNIDIGNPGVAADTNTLRIGTSGGGGQNRAFVAGIRGVTTGAADAVPVVIDSNGQLGTTSSSRRFKFDIAEMSSASDKLMNLRPVTFRYLAHGENAPLQYGLIAEEVAEVYPEMVARNKDGEVETIMYQFLAPMLLNEVQKQHRQIEEQQKIIDALLAQRAAENTAMRNQIDRLLQRVDQLDGKRNASEEIRNALK